MGPRPTPSGANVKEWMEKADYLVSQIACLVASNGPEPSPLTVYPQDTERIQTGVTGLGYKDVNSFCLSFPAKFNVDAVTGVITLMPAEGNGLFKKDSLTGSYNPAPPNLTSRGTEEKNRESPKKADNVHFKFYHEGKLRRFALSRDDPNLFGEVKKRVEKIFGKRATLFWKDESCRNVLGSNEDIFAAIDYAERLKKPPCIDLEITVLDEMKKEKQEEQVEEKKDEEKIEVKESKEIKKEELTATTVVSREESAAAFNDFAFMCDSCDCYLSPATGGRFKCVVCDNYDLCFECVAKGAHDNHALVRLLNGRTIVPMADFDGRRRMAQLMDVNRCTPTFAVIRGSSPSPSEEEKEAKNKETESTFLAKRLTESGMKKAVDETARKMAAFEQMREEFDNEKKEEAQIENAVVRRDPAPSPQIRNFQPSQEELVRNFDLKLNAYFERTTNQENGKTREQIEARLKEMCMTPAETLEQDREWDKLLEETGITVEESDAKIESELGSKDIDLLATENPLFDLIRQEDEEAWRIMELERNPQAMDGYWRSPRIMGIKEREAMLKEEKEKKKKDQEQIRLLEEGRRKIENLMKNFSLNDRQDTMTRNLENSSDALGFSRRNQEDSENDEDLPPHNLDAMQEWKQDEDLGDKATKAPILYVNLIYPEINRYIPELDKRIEFIINAWRDLAQEIRDIYIEKARENRRIAEGVSLEVIRISYPESADSAEPSELSEYKSEDLPEVLPPSESAPEAPEVSSTTSAAPAKSCNCSCSCIENQRIGGMWPSEKWSAGWNSKDDGNVSEKFLQDRKEFLERLNETSMIPIHMERMILDDIQFDTREPEALPVRIERFYCLVNNNIRLHVFQEHDKILMDNRDVENEMIRLIAVDLSKRLMKMHYNVLYAHPESRLRLIADRIQELDKIIEKSEEQLDCKFSAMQLRPILCSDTYTMSYESIEPMDAYRRARDFSVQLNIQREERRDVATFERIQREDSRESDRQQALLAQLVATGIFDDYDRMAQVCILATELEQAIEMML